MVEEIAFENGRISNFQGLVALTTVDLGSGHTVILHTAIHHSSTSTYTPNFIEIEATFCEHKGVRMDGRTFETHFIRSTQKSLSKNG